MDAVSTITAVTMPKWGLEMTEGSIAAWHLAEGTPAPKGAELADIETAKIVNTLEAETAGVVRRVIARVGDTLPVGALLAVLADAVVPDEDIDAFIAGFTPLGETPPPPPPAPTRASEITAAPSSGEVNATPMALRIAASLGVDIATVKGSGRNGKITQEDVEAAAAQPTAPAPSAEPYEIIPHSAMRKAIGDTLLRSKQTIPHFYLTIDVEMDGLLALRAEMNAASGAAKLSVNDFLLRATVRALAESPDVNVHYTEAGIWKFTTINLGVAVAVDDGLLVPVIHAAENKSVAELGAATKRLAEAARTRKLKISDMVDGTFTVSNLGMFGIRHFEAIINPPQGAILAIGGTRRDAKEVPGGLQFVTQLSVTLSCDHRAIDGAVGAKFLSVFKHYVETPNSLIV